MPEPLHGLGFKYMNCILIIGNVGQLFAFNLFLAFVYSVVAIIIKCKYKRDLVLYYNKLKKKLFWQPYIMLCYRAFIPICIATTLNEWYYINTTSGEIISNYYSFLLRYILLGWFPFLMLFVILVPKEKLKSP